MPSYCFVGAIIRVSETCVSTGTRLQGSFRKVGEYSYISCMRVGASIQPMEAHAVVKATKFMD